MSYGHSIYLDTDFDRAAMGAAFLDIRELIARTEIKVVGPEGRPKSLPVIKDGFVAFNGINHNCVCDESNDRYHELYICSRGCWSGDRWRDDSCVPFWIDIRPEELEKDWYYNTYGNRYCIDCTTRRKPYDKMVMMAMIAVKHHLGDAAKMHSKGRWDIEWSIGAGFSTPKTEPGAIATYEHVFPNRAPVPNILSYEGDGA